MILKIKVCKFPVVLLFTTKYRTPSRSNQHRSEPYLVVCNKGPRSSAPRWGRDWKAASETGRIESRRNLQCATQSSHRGRRGTSYVDSTQTAKVSLPSSHQNATNAICLILHFAMKQCSATRGFHVSCMNRRKRRERMKKPGKYLHRPPPRELPSLTEDIDLDQKTTGLDTGLAVTWLGTSSGSPTLSRNVSSILVRVPDKTFVFDAGEGTQMQIIKSKVFPSTIRR